VLMNVDPTTGKAITPPPPPSLLVEWENGQTIDVSSFGGDVEVAAFKEVPPADKA
jgi:hypothetical protein